VNCYHCKKELIWSSDIDISHESENYAIESYLYCENCGSEHLVYLPKEEEKDDDSKSTVRSTE